MAEKHRARILIVEDEESMALRIERDLKQLGYEVLKAVTTGQEAILQVRDNLPDLVLMDITLNGEIDGIQAAEQIRLFNPLPIVYITGRVDIEQWHRAKITEPFGYLLKPFELRELDVVIAAALYKYAKEKELLTMRSDFRNMEESLKDLRGKLVQLEKLASIGQLTAGVAHEINNPVGYISNNIELLRQYIEGYIGILRIVDNLKKSIAQDNMEKVKSIIQDMSQYEEKIGLEYTINDAEKLLCHTQRGIDRIQKVVMGLRTFARSNQEMIETVDIEAILEGVIPIVWNEIKYKAELKKEYAKPPLVKCNSQEVGQVFINLLVNAAQAIAEKGEINIKTYRTETYVCVAISDTGCGISPENLKKLFTPFFTTKKAGLGTGLGLSISYDIIKKYNGDILISSQPGEGATFTVRLPMQDA